MAASKKLIFQLRQFSTFFHENFMDRLCAISALQITKRQFATFDFFVKIMLVSTVWVSMSLSKSGYSERPQRPRDPNVQNYFSRVHIVGYYVCVSLFFTFFLV